MPREQLSTDNRAALAAQVKQAGLRATARAAAVHPSTLHRAIRGDTLDARSLQRLSRIAPKVRTADEFRGRPAPATRPTRQRPVQSWTVESIRAARDAQMLGDFAQPVRLAEAIATDDALFVARQNRVAPQYAIASRLTPASGAQGAAVAARAMLDVHVSRGVLAGINATLADHGIAIGHIERETSPDGTRVSFRLTEWPLEFVKLDATRDVLTTRVRAGVAVDIVHGDGEWIIFRRGADRPWIRSACILPAALCWAAHAEGLADWNATTRAHGLAKILGELPEGLALRDADGGISPQADAMLEVLVGIVSGDQAAGVLPAGAKANWVTSGSSAWQVFSELLSNREKAAARIYTGTDAALGSVGGAPGVDIAALFGVATTIVQGDCEAIAQGLNSGLFDPWCAINYGSSRYAPRWTYQIPDPDSDAKHAERRTARERLHATLAEMRDQKLAIDQAVVDALAAELGVEPAPRLADVAAQTSSLQLAPTDVARVVRVREARESQGLPPLGDYRDDLMIADLETRAAATVPAA